MRGARREQGAVRGLSKRESQLLALLESSAGPAPLVGLSQSMFGDAGHLALVRVHVCRLRSKLWAGAIMTTRGGYLLTGERCEACHGTGFVRGSW